MTDQYQYIVDRAARRSPSDPPGSQPIVCISLALFDALPDGTALYDHSGRIYFKGQGEMGEWQNMSPYDPTTSPHPSLCFTVYGVGNFGFLATDDDLQHPQAFMGPYRES